MTKSRFAPMLGISLVAAVLLGTATAYVASNNFHAIVEGQAYRSAQPSAGHIRQYRRDYGIATIINLRGANAGKRWYDEEVAAAKELGIRHVDFPMSASVKLTPERSRALIEIMRAVPKPVLIHCKGGSDRTGLASAYYLAAIAGRAEETAEGQLSIRFGHVGIPALGAYAMDRSFEAMEAALGFGDS